MTVTSGQKCAELLQNSDPLGLLGKNVSGLIRDALDEVLESLEETGYTARAYALKACEVGALFAGERIAIVASTNNRSAVVRRSIQFSSDVGTEGSRDHHRGRAAQFDTGEWWALKSRPYGVADGIPNRMDRIRCLGNAVVPQQFYPIF